MIATPTTIERPSRPAAPGQGADAQATALTRARYDRIAPVYDVLEAMMERRSRPWRQTQWRLISGPRVLEVGVGTGYNLPFWPAGRHVTGIDLSPRMLARASQRAAALGLEADLRPGDVQARVVRPGGGVVLLEHLRPDWRLPGAILNALNPLLVRIVGANINRRTVENVQAAGLALERVENLALGGRVKLIVARAPSLA